MARHWIVGVALVVVSSTAHADWLVELPPGEAPPEVHPFARSMAGMWGGGLIPGEGAPSTTDGGKR